MRAAEADKAPPFSIDASGLTAVAVAVSGGSDSIALLHLVKRWADARHVHVTALTVDHGLRQESVQEVEQVGRWATALNVPHVVLRWLGEKPKSGLQAKARDARYDLMTQWCEQNVVNCLLTAHTENDQAETVAMRMTRTQTDASLAGIRPVLMWNGIRIVRPLLGVRRQVLRDWLSAIGQGWIDDPSNENPMFERVRVRRQLAESDIATFSQQARDALVRAQQEDADALAFLKSHVRFFREGFATIAISAGQQEVDDAVISLLLRIIGSGTHVRKERERLALWLKQAGSGRRTLGGVIIAKRKAEIVFMREAGRIAKGISVIPDSGNLLWDGRFRISGPPGTQIASASQAGSLMPCKGMPSAASQSLPADVSGAKEMVIAHFEPKTIYFDESFMFQLFNDPARLGIRIDATYVKLH